MRRGPLILAGVCVATAAAAGGGWYAIHSGDPLAQARTLMQQGDYRAAQLSLKDLLRSHPELAEAHVRLGRVQLQLGDPVAAEHELREATARGADEHVVRPILAQALAGERQAELVLRDFDDRGLDASQSADLHIARSMAALLLRQFDVARTEALAAQAAAPRSAEAALVLARAELAAGSLEGGSRAVDQALANDPHYYPALVMRARILAQQGKVQEAIAAFDVLFADPASQTQNLAGDRLAQANLYIAKGDDAAARRDVEAALKAAPRALFGSYLLAVLEVRAKHWRAADDAMAALGPDVEKFPRGNLLLAAVKLNIGQPQQALDAAERFYTRNPKDLAGAKLLATVDVALNRAPAALKLLEPWIGANPPDPGVLALVSQAYAALGQPAQAQDALKQAAALNQSNPAALTLIANLAVNQGNATLGADVLQGVLAGKSDPNRAIMVNAPGSTPAPSRADTAAALVTASLRAGQIDRADSALQALQAAHGDPKQIDLLTGAVRLSQYDLKGARAALESARTRDPAAADVVADLARVMALQGNSDGAIALLQGALAKRPADPALIGAWLQLAASREPAAAIPVLEAAHAAAPDDTNLSVLLAGQYLRAKQADKALSLAGTLPANSPVQLSLRADAERQLGHAEQAAALWQTLIDKTPQDAALRRRIIGFLLADKQDATAATMVQQALQAFPVDAGLQAEAVALAMRKGGLPAALSRADAFAAHSTNPGTLVIKGDLLLAEHAYADAAAAFAQARTAEGLAPEGAEVLVIRQASAMTAAGDTAGSTKLLQDWQATHPNATAVTSMLAEHDISGGRLDDANAKFETVLARFPNDPTALNNLGWIAQQKGDYAKSVRLSSRAYAIAPTPQAADTLGWSLFKTGKPQEAAALLGQAAAGDTRDPSIQYHYAAALNGVGKTDAAKTLIKAVVAAGPFGERADAVQLLQSLGGP